MRFINRLCSREYRGNQAGSVSNSLQITSCEENILSLLHVKTDDADGVVLIEHRSAYPHRTTRNDAKSRLSPNSEVLTRHSSHSLKWLYNMRCWVSLWIKHHSRACNFFFSCFFVGTSNCCITKTFEHVYTSTHVFYLFWHPRKFHFGDTHFYL